MILGPKRGETDGLRSYVNACWIERLTCSRRIERRGHRSPKRSRDVCSSFFVLIRVCALVDGSSMFAYDSSVHPATLQQCSQPWRRRQLYRARHRHSHRPRPSPAPAPASCSPGPWPWHARCVWRRRRSGSALVLWGSSSSSGGMSSSGSTRAQSRHRRSSLLPWPRRVPPTPRLRPGHRRLILNPRPSASSTRGDGETGARALGPSPTAAQLPLPAVAIGIRTRPTAGAACHRQHQPSPPPSRPRCRWRRRPGKRGCGS